MFANILGNSSELSIRNIGRFSNLFKLLSSLYLQNIFVDIINHTSALYVRQLQEISSF